MHVESVIIAYQAMKIYALTSKPQEEMLQEVTPNICVCLKNLHIRYPMFFLMLRLPRNYVLERSVIAR